MNNRGQIIQLPPLKIHLLTSLPARLTKYITGVVERKARVGPYLPDVRVCGVEFYNFAEVLLCPMP